MTERRLQGAAGSDGQTMGGRNGELGCEAMGPESGATSGGSLPSEPQEKTVGGSNSAEAPTPPQE